jgi:cytochrome b subunit of formate dehydrogenase
VEDSVPSLNLGHGLRRRPVCVAAAALWLAVPRAVAEEPPACVECHEADLHTFRQSVHGGLGCADCHAAAQTLPHGPESSVVDCAMCHDEAAREYRESVHGRARTAGAREAPDCSACHGEIHALAPVTDPRSPVHPTRLPETCGSCHADPAVVAKFGIPVARPLEAYLRSVHARRVGERRGGPACSDCHGSHGIFPPGDARSTVFHARVPETCGRCHSEIAEAFRGSIHGQAVAHGVREAPVCTDCHGEHGILSPQEHGSPVFATNIPRITCGRCHADLRLAEKFGLPADRVPAYEDSYHGLAARAGALTVAHCGSCHGVHDILPSSDPRSHTHRDSLPATCGKCHPGAGTRFAIGAVHVLPTERGHAAVYLIRVIYLWVIGLTIGGMVAHNLLDLSRKLRCRPAANWTPRPQEPDEERMSRGFRVAHGLLVISFAVLVYTGFALKYPEAWWARPLVRWESTLGLRGWLHRAAAVVLMADVAFHLIHLALDRRARACVTGMRPTFEDLRELRERVGYWFGRRPDPPHTGRVGYPEKLEYLALVWGVVVMSVTGLVLWFEGLALRWLPKWVGDVATVIHFYEAVLASLAILVWHFYFVIFDPVVYPMDTAWLSGRSPAARAAERQAHGAPHAG